MHIEEQKRKEAAEKSEKARALKDALREIEAAKYTEDETGKRTKIPDPAIEQMKKMRQLEQEQKEAMKERDAALAAKEAAFEKAKKEEAAERERQVSKRWSASALYRRCRSVAGALCGPSCGEAALTVLWT